MADPRIDEYARLLVEYSTDVPFAEFLYGSVDEKIAGTVHLAVGNSYTSSGGTNESAVHWVVVKDLRSGGRIFLDDELVQEDGQWRF